MLHYSFHRSQSGLYANSNIYSIFQILLVAQLMLRPQVIYPPTFDRVVYERFVRTLGPATRHIYGPNFVRVVVKMIVIDDITLICASGVRQGYCAWRSFFPIRSNLLTWRILRRRASVLVPSLWTLLTWKALLTHRNINEYEINFHQITASET